eukprot:2889951-Prymnesium_polylepis.1
MACIIAEPRAIASSFMTGKVRASRRPGMPSVSSLHFVVGLYALEIIAASAMSLAATSTSSAILRR